ncbi:MAG: NlpC/P60 family protein [Acidimicrobiales bacterium]
MKPRGLLGLISAVAVLSIVVGGAVLLQRQSGPSVDSQPPTTLAPEGAQASAVNPPEAAMIDVAVATLWAEPGQARPLDQPSLTNPVDVKRWLSSMNDSSKRWLVDKLVTQVLYGEKVTVIEQRGEWSRIVVPSQPSTLDPRGYPGWLPSVQLAGDDGPTTRPRVVVTKPTTALREADNADKAIMELSYNTTLPVIAVGGQWITVARPHGGKGLVAASDVEMIGRTRKTPTGPDLVKGAQAFSGLPYLWAGNSSAGFDCSGLTSTVFAAHGIVIPRDADEQAAAGTPVDRAHLEPGDLLFFAGDNGKGAIHHVSMYVGDGQMIQSPATGRTVETVPVDTPALAREFWGARRFLPPPSR